MSTIKKILIERDKMTENEAKNLIKEAQKQFDIYLSERDLELAENICEEFFGLEPNYLIELIRKLIFFYPQNLRKNKKINQRSS